MPSLLSACETSVAPLGCVIEDNKPLFIGVSDMLKISTNRTVGLLKSELEIQLSELEGNGISCLWNEYLLKIKSIIEERTTREDVIQAVDDGLNHTLNI
jgi:topoisomerase-4 subunit A